MASNGNGHGPLTFNKKQAVPIVGQPFSINGWFPTVLLTCHCEAKAPVMIPRGAAAQCPGCKKLYTIQQIAFTPDGNVNFGIGMMTPEDASALMSGGQPHDDQT
jgi:hypothetical protein